VNNAGSSGEGPALGRLGGVDNAVKKMYSHTQQESTASTSHQP